MLTSKAISQGASSRPPIPPKAANSKLSVISCRARRQLLAPSVARTAISLRRATPRAINRPLTLAQARIRTRPTTAISSFSGVENSLRRIEMPFPPASNLMCCSLNGMPLVIVPAGVLASLICCASRSIPASACDCVTPSLIRPSSDSHPSFRFSMNFDWASCGCIRMGTQISVGCSSTMPW